MSYRIPLFSSLAVVAFLLAGCPGSSNPCSDGFNVRCEGNTAVNCTQHCGFGPCSTEIKRRSCSRSCEVLDEEETEEGPVVATDQVAVCSFGGGTPDGGFAPDGGETGDAASEGDAGLDTGSGS